MAIRRKVRVALVLAAVAGLSGCGVAVPTALWPNGSRLKVCFTQPASADLRARIATEAREWEKWANLHFDFAGGDGQCSAQGTEDIRIGFSQPGSSSLIGRMSHMTTARTTMNLGQFDDPKSAAAQDPATFRRIVLHEFGHAIGLEHEFQSPTAKCSDGLDWEKARAAYATHMKWSARQVDDNLRTIDDSWRPPEERLRTTAFDRASIMQYSLPAYVFKAGAADPCYTAQVNSVLSPTDKEFVGKLYPKPPPGRPGS